MKYFCWWHGSKVWHCSWDCISCVSPSLKSLSAWSCICLAPSTIHHPDRPHELDLSFMCFTKTQFVTEMSHFQMSQWLYCLQFLLHPSSVGWSGQFAEIIAAPNCALADRTLCKRAIEKNDHDHLQKNTVLLHILFASLQKQMYLSLQKNNWEKLSG